MTDQNRIIANIDNGTYKLTQKRGKSAVWSVFTEIKWSDGSTLEGFVYCRKCKHLLKFNGKQKSNLMRHKCFANTSGQEVVMRNVSNFSFNYSSMRQLVLTRKKRVMSKNRF